MLLLTASYEENLRNYQYKGSCIPKFNTRPVIISQCSYFLLCDFLISNVSYQE
jgi:hypothetical protein